MDDLIAFLKARLDEDEAAAKAASSEHPNRESRDGRWQDVGDRHVRYANGAGETLRSVDVTGGPCLWHEQIRVAGDPDGRVAAHIARHDPARVLREVEAKRKILAEHEAVTKLATLTRQELGFLGWYREWVLKNLATAWSDHPDYRAEWKP